MHEPQGEAPSLCLSLSLLCPGRCPFASALSAGPYLPTEFMYSFIRYLLSPCRFWALQSTRDSVGIQVQPCFCGTYRVCHPVATSLWGGGACPRPMETFHCFCLSCLGLQQLAPSHGSTLPPPAWLHLYRLSLCLEGWFWVLKDNIFG